MGKTDVIEKKTRELEAILEVSKLLTSSFDLHGNLNSVMKVLSTHLDMQRGCVYLLDRKTGGLYIASAYGLTASEIQKGKYKIGEGIVGRVLETGSAMIIPDIGLEPLFLNKTGSRAKKDGVSFISVPIRIKGDTLGVLSADRIYTEEHGGLQDDLRVLNITASLIAQFVTLWDSYKQAEEERDSLRVHLKDRFSSENIIGESERFQLVLKSAIKVAATDATVLLLGESGTGKELFAKTIHFQSYRSKSPFIAVNCAALPENLLETELFGCEKGAFTGATSKRAGRFELAKGGTLFLDEIGELPVGVQAKLLRVLEERTFERVGSSIPIKADVRVIAATNRNLLTEVKRGAFREDLYWRLNVVPIVMPALRERKQDIPLLIGFYTKKYNKTYGKRISFKESVITAMSSYGWPGNVRELANTLERLIIMADKDVLSTEDLPEQVFRPAVGTSTKEMFEPQALEDEIKVLESERILRALKDNGFVQQRAARALGITPRQLGYKIKKYEIPVIPQ